MRTEAVPLALALALACLAGGPAAAEEPVVPAVAPIARVTVFTDRAEVVRVAEVDLPAGRSVVEVDGLLPGLEERSLRCVPAGGGEGLRIVDVVSEVHAPERPVREAEQRFQEAKRAIEAQVRAHQDAIVAAKERARLLGELRDHLVKGIQAEVAEAEPPVDRWRRSIDFTAAEAKGLADRLREHEKAIFELNEQLAVEEARLELAAGDETVGETRRVRLWIDAAAAGRRRLELRYQVREGVVWGMRYEARLDRAAGELAFRAMVAVAQETGEDWTDAALVFSTRKPARGLRPPRLHRLVLGARDAAETARIAAGMSRVPLAAIDPVAEVSVDDGPAVREVPAEEPAQVQAPRGLRLQTGLQIRPVAGDVEELEYVGREAMDVRADGLPVLVPLGAWTVAADWRYECLPDVLAAVFVRGGFANPLETRLLGGPVEAFLDGVSIGEVEFPATAGGARAELAFGSVEGLAVSRTAAPLRSVTRSTEGTDAEARTVREFAYDFTIDLANRTAEDATVRVREAIPTSGVETVVVTLAEETTPAKDLGNGILEWDVAVPANGGQTIRLRYVIGIDKTYRN